MKSSPKSPKKGKKWCFEGGLEGEEIGILNHFTRQTPRYAQPVQRKMQITLEMKAQGMLVWWVFQCRKINPAIGLNFSPTKNCRLLSSPPLNQI